MTPTVPAEPTPTTAVVAPTTSHTAVPAPVVLPAGPYYLPAELPDGWEISALRFFENADVDDHEGSDSITLIVHTQSRAVSPLVVCR